MFKNLIRFYCMMICFISSIILIFTVSNMLTAATDLTLLKEYNHYIYFDRFAHNQEFLIWDAHHGYLTYYNPHPSESEITKARLEEKQRYVDELENDAIKQLIDYSRWLITASLFFFIHWKLYHRQEE